MPLCEAASLQCRARAAGGGKRVCSKVSLVIGALVAGFWVTVVFTTPLDLRGIAIVRLAIIANLSLLGSGAGVVLGLLGLHLRQARRSAIVGITLSVAPLLCLVVSALL
jgi:hypothetical protein